MRVRPIYREEMNDALRLIHCSIRALNSKDYTPVQIERIVRSYGMASLVGGVVLVAEQRSKMVGVAKVSFGLLSAQLIEAVFTHPEHVYEGVGRALVFELEKRANRHNLQKLSVIASLTAVGFYQSLNYEQIRAVTINGSIQCVLMEKQLRPATAIDHYRGALAVGLVFVFFFVVLYAIVSVCLYLLLSGF
ncbi:MAG: GNAT family N-acetyltransferase [Cyanobacteria bacterium J06560_2]